MKINDLTGKQFGRWRVIGLHPERYRRSAVWVCKCACGNVLKVTRSNLISGKTSSCGCYRSEVLSERQRKYSDLEKTLYITYHSMLNRCYNPKVWNYKYYGAKGVKVCKSWRDDFKQFFQDMGPRSKGKTLDRIDPYGNYEPNNCRRADRHTQRVNQRPKESK